MKDYNDNNNEEEEHNLDGIHSIDGESLKAFRCFCFYRDSGGTLSWVDLSEKVEATPGTIKAWASKHKWQERITNYMAQNVVKRDEKVLDDVLAELYKVHDLIKPTKFEILERLIDHYHLHKNDMDYLEQNEISKMITAHSTFWEELSGIQEVAAILNKRLTKDLK